MFFLLILLFLAQFNFSEPLPFMTHREKSDLQLNRFIDALDSTQTLGGRKALEEILSPTSDLAVIQKRQSIIKLLLDDDELYNSLENQLSKISSCQTHIFSYLEKKPNMLEFQSEALYFQPLANGSLFKKIANFCNKSSLMLEGSIIKQLWNSFAPIIFQLGLAGVSFKYNQWLFEQTDHFEYWEGFKLGLETPIKNHSWTPYTTQEKLESHDTGMVSHQLYTKSFLNGSFRDRYEVLKNGMVGSVSFSKNLFLPICHPPLARPLAFLIAASFTACSDVMQGFSIVSAWSSFTLQYATIQKLKKQLFYLRQYLNRRDQLSKIINAIDEINNTISTLSPNNKSKLQELKSHLSQGTFSSPDGYFYRRGLVLWLHKKMPHYCQLLGSIVDQVGTIDAYMSIARSIKKLQAHNLPVCFASFTQSPNTCIITDGWILTTPDTCVQNTVELGGTSARAIILSGPHGCGKSTILTLLGHTAILTHSIGIGFASNIIISPLEGIRSSFSTDSVPEKGFSTFMAAQQSIQQIEQFIDHLSPNQTGMILLSEPYKGTVEAEAAYRIDLFCREHFMKHPALVMALETHVAGPMKLAEEFPESFANKQMAIKVLDDGTFERTFEMIDEAAYWWFNNDKLRSDYVNFLNTLVKRKIQ